MDENTGLAIGAGIAQGLDQATKNLFNISVARHKLKQENEIFNIEKKQKELEIKKMEYVLSPEQLEAEQQKLKAETAAKTSEYNLNLLKMNSAASAEQRKVEEHTKAMAMFDKFIQSGNPVPYGTSINVGGMTIRGTADADLTAIREKVGKGMPLTPGEQKLYDDIIKKKTPEMISLAELISGNAPASKDTQGQTDWWNQ
jgi:hypothetical protein